MIIQTYLAIAWFFLICLLFGISLDYFFRFTRQFEENMYKVLSLICIGFGFFGLIIYVVGLFRIPLHYLLFLGISAIIPLYWLITKQQEIIKFNYKILIKKPSPYQIILIIILAVFFIFMIRGAFSYPWLEDDDPWTYAAGAKYVAVNMDYHTPQINYGYNNYLFPQSHSMLTVMYGILNQITPELYQLMKIFINIILLMGVIAFFLFAYHFSNKKELFATIATFILVITPCFAGHFIFDYTLSVMMLIVFLLSLSFALNDKKCMILSALILATVLIAHPTTGLQTAVIMFILLIIYLARELSANKFDIGLTIKGYKESKVFVILAIGILGMIFCSHYYTDFVSGNGINILRERAGGSGGVFSFNYNMSSYDIEDKHLQDFFIAQNVSHMDQEDGVGVVLFIVCIFGIFAVLLVKDLLNKNNIIYLSLFLFYFLFLWIFTGGYFHFSVQNYRWQSVFAIFIALHATATIMILLKLVKEQKVLAYAILFVLALGMIYTSAIPRYTVQTSQWPPGASWTSNDEVTGYVGLRDMGYDNKVFGMCGSYAEVIANNQNSMPWEKDIEEYILFIRNNSINKTSEDITLRADKIISSHDFKYIIISGQCVKIFELNTTNDLLQYYSSTKGYSLVKERSNSAFFVLQVR